MQDSISESLESSDPESVAFNYFDFVVYSDPQKLDS